MFICDKMGMTDHSLWCVTALMPKDTLSMSVRGVALFDPGNHNRLVFLTGLDAMEKNSQVTQQTSV